MKSLTSAANTTRGASAAEHSPIWRGILADAVRSPVELCRLLDLPELAAHEAALAAGGFPLLVPRPFLDRIRPGDLHDPLLRQVWPQASEQIPTPGFCADPLQEAASASPCGVLSKYPGRVLIIATGACAVHCRYCFRRHFPYDENNCTSAGWRSVAQAIAADASVEEAILSGGDPLMLDDAELGALVQRLAEIPHLRRLRVHSRLPIMIPQRVTGELTSALRATRLTPIVVVQSNHPAELDAVTGEALGRLVDAGIPVLNQAVLLRAVNDRVETLAQLCRRLVDLRVMPYYLHQLDRVAGAAHFEVPEIEGLRLVEQLRACLPGYAVPRYVRETPGQTQKQMLG